MLKPPVHTYLLKGIPPKLWAAGQTKAAALAPPSTMRRVLIDLLKDWTAATEDPPPPTSVAPPPPQGPAPRRAKKPTRVRTPHPPPGDEPDLGAGF